MNWYKLTTDETLSSLKTTIEGLTLQEAEKRLKEHGPNKLPEEKAVSRLKMILHQFTSPLIYIRFFLK